METTDKLLEITERLQRIVHTMGQFESHMPKEIVSSIDKELTGIRVYIKESESLKRWDHHTLLNHQKKITLLMILPTMFGIIMLFLTLFKVISTNSILPCSKEDKNKKDTVTHIHNYSPPQINNNIPSAVNEIKIIRENNIPDSFDVKLTMNGLDNLLYQRVDKVEFDSAIEKLKEALNDSTNVVKDKVYAMRNSSDSLYVKLRSDVDSLTKNLASIQPKGPFRLFTNEQQRETFQTIAALATFIFLSTQ